MTIILGGTYTEVGATAVDNLDGNLTNKILISGIVDTSYQHILLLKLYLIPRVIQPQ